MSVAAYIALGSNLGDRRAAIDSALRAIAATNGVRLKTVSSVIETEPLARPDSNMDPGGAYLNAVASIETDLPPRELLNRCLAIERAHGRNRHPEERWGPRTLDLDLLLYGDLVITEPGLEIPHPRLHEREFVLRPFSEIAPALIHPTLGRTVQCLLEGL